MEYDYDQVLTKYIWDNYYHLLTSSEKLVAKAALAEEKAKASSERLAKAIRRRWEPKQDPEIMEALQDGAEAFRRQVCERVLRENADDIVINRCPACKRIVRTPKARQCLWCGNDWHEGS